MKKYYLLALLLLIASASLRAQRIQPPKAPLDSLTYDPAQIGKALLEAGTSLKNYHDVRKRGFINTYTGLLIMGTSGALLAAEPGETDNSTLYYVTGGLGFFLSLTGSFQIASSGKHLKGAAMKLEQAGTIMKLKFEF